MGVRLLAAVLAAIQATTFHLEIPKRLVGAELSSHLVVRHQSGHFIVSLVSVLHFQALLHCQEMIMLSGNIIHHMTVVQQLRNGSLNVENIQV